MAAITDPTHIGKSRVGLAGQLVSPDLTGVAAVRSLVQLIGATARLALDPADQVEYLSRIGTLPLLDELGLEFDDRFVLVPQLRRMHWFTAGEVDLLAAIDTRLASLPKDPELWRSEAALEREEWAAVRAAAREFLKALGEGAV